MKTSGPLTLAFSLSFAAAVSVMGADKPNPAPAEPAAPPAPAKAAVIPDPVAIVEGHEIKKAELDKALGNVLAAQGIPASQLPDDQRLQGYHMVLDNMIIERLIADRSEKEKVTPEEVAAQFDKLKAKFGSDEELKKQLEKAGETEDKVKNGIRERLQQQHWMDAQVIGKTDVTDADAEDFYKKNPEQFKSPERVRASHILIAVPEDAKPEVVAQKQKAAQAIADRVKKGEAFDKLAKELSEDPSAKENSGDLDFFTKEQMVPEFANAAFSMKKDEISNPVRSSFGFHIIKVTDHKDAETVTLEKVKPQLLAYLKQQKKTAALEKIVQDIKEKADIKVNLPDAPKASPQ
jgi:parvulin-like peptidyl-prolyl isomerase